MGAVIVALVGALMVLSSGERLGDETVVVLPSADGHVGMVVVERGGERVVLNQAYATSRIVDGGKPVLQAAEASRAAAPDQFAAVLGALPGRPESFLVYFNEGTDELTAESRVEFQNILAALRERSAPDVVVIGHTDRLAADDYNDRLSLMRAERVRAELVELGILAARIRIAGRGEREPLVPTADGVAEPRNRRVEINVR
jgi:outer membrane protein OmpA-like peptidoglycan-associated protein